MYAKCVMIKQISLIMVVAMGLLLIPLTNEAAASNQPHLHGTSGSTHHHLAGIGFIAGSFFKFHQHTNV
jgi:hypothetical protein